MNLMIQDGDMKRHPDFTTLLLEGTSEELEALAHALQMKARHPDNWWSTYTGIEDIHLEIGHIKEEPPIPDLHNVFFLFKLLWSLERSMETPVARREGAKACPYCAHHKDHDPECKLDQCLTRFRAGDRSSVLIAEMQIVLKELGRINHKGELVIYENDPLKS